MIGTQLITKVPAAGLRPALGCVLLASALGVLSKAGVAVAPQVLIGVPLAAGLGAYMLSRARRVGSAPTEVEVAPA